MRPKYTIVDGKYPIIMTDASQHGDFGQGLKKTSAGHCSIDFRDNDVFVSCWGSSIGLKVNSDPKNDEELIQEMLRGEFKYIVNDLFPVVFSSALQHEQVCTWRDLTGGKCTVADVHNDAKVTLHPDCGTKLEQGEGDQWAMDRLFKKEY